MGVHQQVTGYKNVAHVHSGVYSAVDVYSEGINVFCENLHPNIVEQIFKYEKRKQPKCPSTKTQINPAKYSFNIYKVRIHLMESIVPWEGMENFQGLQHEGT